MAAFTFFISGLILCGGILALAANPRRVTNQLFLLGAVFIAAASACIGAAIIAGNRYEADGVTNPLPWIRANAILGNLFLPTLIAIRESIRSPTLNKRNIARAAFPWLVLSLIPSAIALTNWYIPDDSTHYNRKRGDGYYVSAAIGCILYSLVFIQTLSAIRKEKGIRRIELKFLVLHSAFALAAFSSINGLANLTKLFAIKPLALVLMTSAFYSSGWLICHHHIFDLRQVAGIILRRATTITAISALAIATSLTASLWTHSSISIAIGIASAGLLATWIDSIVVQILHGGSDSHFTGIRDRIIEISRGSANTTRLLNEFNHLIKSESAASFVNIMIDEEKFFRSANFSIASSSEELKANSASGWSTPEALHRRRPTSETAKLASLLEAHYIGLIIAIPTGSRSPSMLVIFGIKQGAQPYTYPEVQRLFQLAELMDNILTRARLTEQAALQAKMEHLAMMSRGLAHDLKNLITPISSYLIHTDGKYPPDTPEAEVHAAARRSVRIMEDYIRDALFFSNRLAPKVEKINIVNIFSAVLDITGPRASSRSVQLNTTNSLREAPIADPILIQRLLVNLVSNAIDASRAGQTVRLTAATTRPGWCGLSVQDNGDGIAPEHLDRIFDPYFTTKQFGDEVRGFGLGLTIADKIARLHAAQITVKSELGLGTTMRVEIPLTQTTTPATPELAMAVASV